MSSSHLAARFSDETLRGENIPKSPFKFANAKASQGGLHGHLHPLPSIKEGAAGDISSDPFLGLSSPTSRLVGKVTNVYYEYIPLSQAISRGDLEDVKDFLNQRPDAVDAWINFYETPLLKACACGKVEIVKEILKRMTPEQMLPRNHSATNHTPLTVVAVNGNVEIARVLVAKNNKLLEIPGINGQIAVVVAVENTQDEMAHYLYEITPIQVLLDEDGYHGTFLLLNAIFYKMLDIALDLFGRCPRLAVTKHPKIESIPIIVLASKPDLFHGGCYLGFWECFIYSWINNVILPTLPKASHPMKDQSTLLGNLCRFLSKWSGVDRVFELKVMHLQARKLLLGIAEETLAMGLKERSEAVHEALLFAVRYGNVDFLVEMIKNNSELLWSPGADSSNTLFLLAVAYRQEKIFSLLYGMDDRKHLLLADKDINGDGVLHLAAYPSPPVKLTNVVGAALQMQRELQWFKEVGSIVPEIEKERINTEEKTPNEIFTEGHEGLRKEAEEWMKGTANSCSLVAALIVTVTFAAVFTVPGGIDDKSGEPFRLKDNHFRVFIVTDMISCFAACTSVLIFLGILTARYSLEDFLVSLPAKMIAGLSILFVSIAAMLVAFSSAIFTTLHNKWSWIVVPAVLLACLPALLFVLLQYPLLKEMIVSTFGKGIFDRKMKRWL